MTQDEDDNDDMEVDSDDEEEGIPNTTPTRTSGLETRVAGTLFGNRRGYVHFSAQDGLTRLPPVLSVFARDMASGLVRIALECEKNIISITITMMAEEERYKLWVSKKLLGEPTWRTYGNGRKCGLAAMRECGAAGWRVLSVVELITMGTGVLRAAAEVGNGAVGSDMGEHMHMRARF